MEIPEVVRGIYLVPPHGTWLMSGEKKAVLKSRFFDVADEPLAVIEDQQLLGVVTFHEPLIISRDLVPNYFELHRVTQNELDQWWPEASSLYLYLVKEVRPYPEPIHFDTPPGVQTFLERVPLPNRELLKAENTEVRVLGTKGFVTWRGRKYASILIKQGSTSLRVDKGDMNEEGELVLVTHNHPDHVGGIDPEKDTLILPETFAELFPQAKHKIVLPIRVPFRVGPFTITAYPVLHSSRVPTYAFRIETAGLAIAYAPDILGWERKRDRLECLEDADLYFIDGSHISGIARRSKDGKLFGHAPFITQGRWAQDAGVKRVIITHLGEEMLNLDEEGREEVARSLTEKFGIPFEIAKEDQVIQVLEKLDLPRFQAEGVDYDIENAPKRWRELLADLRYLGNSAYPRLKRGEKWGDWTLTTVLRYFGKIVDVLRSLYFPLLPPSPDDPAFNTPYWECYREAKARHFIQSEPPSPEELKEWDKKRAELLKDDLSALHASLPDSFLVLPEWASLTGSLVYGQHPPHDIDVILKASVPSGSLLKLQRLLQERHRLPVQFSLEREGASWDYVPLYDLVAKKVPFSLVRVREDEVTRARLYKARLVENPQAFKPGVPIVHYDVAGEFYIPQELELAFEKWASRILREEDLVVQPKFDGIRFIVSQDEEGNFFVFSEKGINRASAFPNLDQILSKKLRKPYILDVEAVEFDPAFQVQLSRTEMAWMSTAKKPKPGAYVKIFVHDLVFYGESLVDRPYLERLQLAKKLLGRPFKANHYMVEIAETKILKKGALFPEFEEAVLTLSKPKAGRSTEGAMLKRAGFRYDPKEARTSVVKLKNRIEIDALIIGVREMPKPKPEKEKLSEEEAEKLLAEHTSIWLARLALLDERTKKLVPIESRKRLSERDLTLRWNEEKQIWEGTDDPKLWTMFFGLPHREKGSYAYGNSYAFKYPKKPQLGTVLTISPMEITLWEDEDGVHVSFQHPIPVGVKEDAPPGTIQAALRAHGKVIPKRPWASLLL